MNDAAAFQATYSDFRIVKGRKVAQFVLEVPLEGADAALEVLGGVPRPDRETWVACARLSEGSTKLAAPQAAQVETPKAQAAPDLPNKPPVRPLYPQQAGYMAKSLSFVRFLKEKMPDLWAKSRGPEDQPAPENFDRAAIVIRRYCRVDSRAEILPGTEAENRWLLLVSSFRAWQDAPRMGAA